MKQSRYNFAVNLHPRTATMMIVATALCFGLVPFFARELQALDVGASAIALYRYIFSAAVLLPFLPFSKGKRRAGLLMTAAGFGMGLGWVGYLEAVEKAPVAAAGVVYMSYPVFTMLFAWLLLKQRPTWRAGLAAGFILTAGMLLFDGSGLSAEALRSLIWSLPAPITFGFIIVVLSSLTGSLSPVERMACGMSGAVVALLPMALSMDTASIIPSSADHWLLVAGLGLLTALIPQLLYSYACPQVGPARAAAAGSFELPTMLAIGWLAFGEAIGPLEAMAALLVVTAILIVPPVTRAAEPVRAAPQPAI